MMRVSRKLSFVGSSSGPDELKLKQYFFVLFQLRRTGSPHRRWSARLPSSWAGAEHPTSPTEGFW